MWIIITILVFFLNAVHGTNLCTQSPFLKCTIPDTEHIETAEDLNELCPKFTSYIKCLGKYDETCKGRGGYKVFPREGEFKNVLEIVADVCKKGSLLHSAVSANAMCIQDNLRDHGHSCRENRSRFISQYMNEQNSSLDNELLFNETTCLRYFYDSSCFASHVSANCGGMAKQAVLEIIHRTRFHRDSCSLQIVIVLSQKVAHMNAEEEEKKNLNEAFFRLMYE